MPQIIVVDDEPDICTIIKQTLDVNEVFEVQTALNGEEGFELFKKYSPQLVITDMRMPVRDGIWLAEQIRAINPNSLIIFMSGFATASPEELGISKRNHFIRKPDDFRNINGIVSSLLMSKLSA